MHHLHQCHSMHWCGSCQLPPWKSTTSGDLAIVQPLRNWKRLPVKICARLACMKVQRSWFSIRRRLRSGQDEVCIVFGRMQLNIVLMLLLGVRYPQPPRLSVLHARFSITLCRPRRALCSMLDWSVHTCEQFTPHISGCPSARGHPRCWLYHGIALLFCRSRLCLR